ncbi:MAG: hypothetical protein HY305_00100, partial [Sphingobacteriales bacterium]|nr:hypothetical protein [Sphingobacteriales bacterium]
MLDQTVASITTMNNPVIDLGQGKKKLSFTDAKTEVIQSSAATFNNYWKVDNAFYWKVETEVKHPWVPLKSYLIKSLSSYVIDVYQPDGGRGRFRPDVVATLYSNQDNILARSYRYGPDTWHETHTTIKDRAYITLDVDKYLAEKESTWIPLYADLNLKAHTEYHPGLHTAINAQSDRGTSYHNAVYIDRFRRKTDMPNLDDYNQYIDDLGLHNRPLYYPNKNAKFYEQNGSWDVTYGLNVKMFNSMVEDRQITTLHPLNTPSFQISTAAEMDDDNGHDVWQCYYGAGVPDGKSPTLNVYYYRKQDVLPYSFAPLFTDIAPGMKKYYQLQDSTVPSQHCQSYFTDNTLNPYVQGILGNWRVDKTYTYYGDRKDKVVALSQNIDTRIAGVIDNYRLFWNFAPETGNQLLSRNIGVSDVWVWNSSITQYNRKGYEVENKDPLDRYNAGLYGYNQQLPVAVANNSRVRQVMFDGFEDYAYKS